MNKLLLYLIMMPSALWRSLGADTHQLRAILQVRLIMDDRKPMTIGRQRKKNFKYGSLFNVLMYLFLGFFYMLPLTVVNDRIYSLTFFFSTILVVLTFMLITDFSSVLFDARDKFILFPRPVDDRTLVLARMLHVFIYLIRIVLPLSLPAWIMLGYLDGWKSALLFPLPLMLLIVLALFLVNSVYLLVLRLTKPEKFKDVINYFQVITSVLFFASFYLLPRLFDSEHPQVYNIIDHPAIRYAPSYWLAVCWSWIGSPVNLHGTAMLSILAIVLPTLCMFILVKWLSPQFARRISGIDTVGTAEHMPVQSVGGRSSSTKSSSGKLYQRLANLVNRTDDAKAGFMIAWLQSSRSRTFRMRVLPSFAFAPVYFFYLLTLHHTSLGYAYAHLADGSSYLLLLYLSSFVMVSALSYLAISDQYKASWVYYSSPVAAPGQIISGALKAIWIKYYLPFVAVISAFVIYTWGATVIMDIALALVNTTLFIAIIARVNFRHLPFSIAEQMKQRGTRVFKSIFVMLLPMTFGFAHYFCVRFHLLWLEGIFLALSAIMLWLVWDSYANITWSKMMKQADEA